MTLTCSHVEIKVRLSRQKIDSLVGIKEGRGREGERERRSGERKEGWREGRREGKVRERREGRGEKRREGR